MAKLWTVRASSEAIRISKGNAQAIIPGTLADLAEVLNEHPGATIVAGATDVGLWVTKQMRPSNPVVFINHLTDLQTITEDESGIVIGAGVTYSQPLRCWKAIIRH